MGPAVAGLLPAGDRFDPIRMTFVSRRCSAVSVNRNRRAVNHFGCRAAQEQDDFGDLLWLWPLGEIGSGHGSAIGFGIDDAGQNGICPNTCASQIGCE
jgi:hypothetical protein